MRATAVRRAAVTTAGAPEGHGGARRRQGVGGWDTCVRPEGSCRLREHADLVEGSVGPKSHEELVVTDHPGFVVAQVELTIEVHVVPRVRGTESFVGRDEVVGRRDQTEDPAGEGDGARELGRGYLRRQIDVQQVAVHLRPPLDDRGSCVRRIEDRFDAEGEHHALRLVEDDDRITPHLPIEADVGGWVHLEDLTGSGHHLGLRRSCHEGRKDTETDHDPHDSEGTF